MMYDDGEWIWGHSWGWGGWIVMGLVMLLFLTALITALVLAVRYLTAPQQAVPPPTGNTPERPERMLAERFARGDIDEDEFRRRMAVLHEYR